MNLGVNIDHIAVLREARKVNDPDIIDALSILKVAGANQITIHLREDRRHIQDNDLKRISELSPLPLNLECAKYEEMINIAISNNPYRVTLVPEKREELTTEGGLIIDENDKTLIQAIKKLQFNGIEVSLFIDPCVDAVNSSLALGVEWIELHTGEYSNIFGMLYGNLSSSHHSIKRLELPRKELKTKLQYELTKIIEISNYATELGLKVAAGHGLNYQNISNIASINNILELNIGQSIIARSLFTGLYQAIVDMKKRLN
jgi:pyridoxine 5-phosphate synthase